MSNDRTIVARAIDVGHGFCKVTTDSKVDGFGCLSYPSITPLLSSNQLDVPFFSENDCIPITIDKVTYLVGPNSEAQASSNVVRFNHADFSMTNNYLALVRGALAYMKVDVIDVLVLGLPLTTFRTHRERLAKKMTGDHEIPNPMLKKNPNVEPTIKVKVRKVEVVPQPAGTLYYNSSLKEQPENMKSSRNLVIDAGYGTLDWFLTDGSSAIKDRCNASINAASQVAKQVAYKIDSSQANNLSTLSRIDTALINRGIFTCNGKKYNIKDDFNNLVEETITSAISEMMRGIDTYKDIDHIFLTGGSAHLFEEQLKKLMADREIIMDQDPIFSNVKGFQVLAEMHANRLK